MAQKKLLLTESEIRSMVNDLLSDNDCREAYAHGVHLSRDDDSTCFSFDIHGDITLEALNAIAREFGDDNIFLGTTYDGDFSLTVIDTRHTAEAGYKSGSQTDEDEEPAPAIPDDYRHTDRFPDSEDIIIPGTEQRVSNTEQSEQILRWMSETGHTPIMYLRLQDGVHVEVSALYDRKVQAILSEGRAVGADGRKYTLADTDRLAPIGSDICVRATADDTGRSDYYGLTFFA